MKDKRITIQSPGDVFNDCCIFFFFFGIFFFLGGGGSISQSLTIKKFGTDNFLKWVLLFGLPH